MVILSLKFKSATHQKSQTQNTKGKDINTDERHQDTTQTTPRNEQR